MDLEGRGQGLGFRGKRGKMRRILASCRDYLKITEGTRWKEYGLSGGRVLGPSSWSLRGLGFRARFLKLQPGATCQPLRRPSRNKRIFAKFVVCGSE